MFKGSVKVRSGKKSAGFSGGYESHSQVIKTTLSSRSHKDGGFRAGRPSKSHTIRTTGGN